jgi:hypothetical protein
MTRRTAFLKNSCCFAVSSRGQRLARSRARSPATYLFPYQIIFELFDTAQAQVLPEDLAYGLGLRSVHVRELTSFPGTKYDDQVDSTTQALDHLKTKRGILVWMKL